jgi:hypothetical protein
MSGAEQTFVMMALARLKDQGRIEVIRERNANYHVFAFIDGQRPRDELIAASIEEVSPPAPETNHATKPPAKVEDKPKAAKTVTNAKTKAKVRKRR